MTAKEKNKETTNKLKLENEKLKKENKDLRKINIDQKEFIEKLERQNEKLRKTCEINAKKLYTISNEVLDLYHNVWDKNMDRAEETKEQFLKIIDQADPDICMSSFFKLGTVLR